MEQVGNPQKFYENKIYFWYQRGVSVEERFEWLNQNLQSKVQELGSNYITVYVWLGTCDLTKKSDNFIELRTRDYTTVRHICRFYKEIYDYVRQFPTINIVFLELPFYSMFLWNLHHNHVKLLKSINTLINLIFCIIKIHHPFHTIWREVASTDANNQPLTVLSIVYSCMEFTLTPI